GCRWWTPDLRFLVHTVPLKASAERSKLISFPVRGVRFLSLLLRGIGKPGSLKTGSYARSVRVIRGRLMTSATWACGRHPGSRRSVESQLGWYAHMPSAWFSLFAWRNAL